MPIHMSLDSKVLRRTIRQQRRHLNKFTQKQSERDVFHKLIRLPQFQHAKNIGIYLHAFGEIQTQMLIEYCFAHKKIVYLPKICTMSKHLHWIKISKFQYHGHRFSNHYLGMQQPMANRGMHVSHLDLLFMPLLACDRFGTRIGMGGGFYDKTLATAPHKPYRIGIAHDFQFIDEPIHREYWDRPLDKLVTPHHIRHFKHKV